MNQIIGQYSNDLTTQSEEVNESPVEERKLNKHASGAIQVQRLQSPPRSTLPSVTNHNRQISVKRESPDKPKRLDSSMDEDENYEGGEACVVDMQMQIKDKAC